MKRLVFVAAAVLLAGRPSYADIATAEAKRLDEASQVVQQIKSEIPEDYWNRARCIAVIPDLKKAAFIVGGEYGKGVMSCRAGERWSAPLFMQLAKGSWGFQAGAQQVDLVLLVMNEEGVQKLLSNKTTLGADASVAAGPIGRHASAGTDARLTAEILSYSRAQGLFAGIDLSGGVLRPDEDANTDAYGRAASPRTILANREISAPTQAANFLASLGPAAPATPGAVGTSGTPSTAATPATPGTFGTPGTPGTPGTSGTPGAVASSPPARPVATTDDDVRAQLNEIRQALDRLITDATSDTIAVDRARLVQIRQQIDAAIAALNRR